MRKTIAVFLVFSLLWLSGGLFAEKKGAEIVIQKKDGQRIKGELIAVKKDSLLLMEERYGEDITVGIEDIEMIKIVKKSKAGMGALFGLLAGGAIGGVSITGIASEGDRAYYCSSTIEAVNRMLKEKLEFSRGKPVFQAGNESHSRGFESPNPFHSPLSS